MLLSSTQQWIYGLMNEDCFPPCRPPSTLLWCRTAPKKVQTPSQTGSVLQWPRFKALITLRDSTDDSPHLFRCSTPAQSQMADDLSSPPWHSPVFFLSFLYSSPAFTSDIMTITRVPWSIWNTESLARREEQMTKMSWKYLGVSMSWNWGRSVSGSQTSWHDSLMNIYTKAVLCDESVHVAITAQTLFKTRFTVRASKKHHQLCEMKKRSTVFTSPSSEMTYFTRRTQWSALFFMLLKMDLSHMILNPFHLWKTTFCTTLWHTGTNEPDGVLFELFCHVWHPQMFCWIHSQSKTTHTHTPWQAPSCHMRDPQTVRSLQDL